MVLKVGAALLRGDSPRSRPSPGRSRASTFINKDAIFIRLVELEKIMGRSYENAVLMEGRRVTAVTCRDPPSFSSAVVTEIVQGTHSLLKIVLVVVLVLAFANVPSEDERGPLGILIVIETVLKETLTASG